jgi:RNA polymerase sigma factor (sigma-70 family)
MPQADVRTLVQGAAAGDPAAWDALVSRYGQLLWWMVRKFPLTEEQAADVVQTTWLTLVVKIGEIREPERLPSWLLTTTRRRCIDVINAAGREQPLNHDDSEPCPAPGPEEHAIRRERQVLVRSALERLPERQRTLLVLLAASPPVSYQEIGRRLRMPIGSIGSARARALRQLRSELAVHDLAEVG